MMTRTIRSKWGRPSLWSGWTVVLAATLLLFACGDGQDVTISGPGGGGGGGGDVDETNRYEELEPLGLEPGEATPGLHLQPGIEIVRLSPDVSDDIEVDTDEMTVELTGEAKEELEEIDEIWSDDILFGEGFIFLVDSIRVEGDRIIIEVRPFELLEVIHGEWSFDFDRHDPTGYLQANVSPDGDVSVGLASFLDNLSASASVDVEVWGELDFPVEWEGKFDGRVSYLGYGLNTEYECETYTETRTRRRYWAFGKKEEYTVEVQPERFCIDHLLVKGSIGMEAEAGVGVEAEASVNYHDSERIRFQAPNGQGFRAPLGQTGLALWLTPFFEAGVRAHLKGVIEASVVGKAQITIPLGFEYIREDGFSMLPNDNHPVMRDGEIDPSLTGEVEAMVNLYNQLGMEFTLSDIASENRGLRATGPEVGIEFGAELVYKPIQVSTDGSASEPCLTAAVYIEPFGKANLRGEVVLTDRWSWGIDVVQDQRFAHRFDLDTFASEGDDFCLFVAEPGTLDVTLTWSEPTLLDLYMITPNGNEINYSDNMADGGQYRTVSVGDPCLDDHTECTAYIDWNIDDTEPPAGEYVIWVENTVAESPAYFQVDVETEYGLLNQFTGNLPNSSGAASNEFTFSIGSMD